MPPENPAPNAAFQVILACGLGAAGLYLLLPKVRGRRVVFGTFLALAGLAVLATFFLDQFGNPERDAVGSWLFYLFATGAVGFAAVLVAQRNPARGAIAFAFVVLNVCGLFVLLAAPFLAAATIVVYAGAIIVTFLFVLMLSHALGHSPENDRTREPLLGALAGFAFAGLVLFGLYASRPATAAAREAGGHDLPLVPVAPLTAAEKATLETVAGKLATAVDTGHTSAKQVVDGTETARAELAGVTAAVAARYRFLQKGGDLPPPANLAVRRLRDVEAKSKAVENALTASADDAKAAVGRLREEVLLFRGSAELPARNVATVGYLLYSEHLIAVELAGTLLLVATIGAVAIAGPKAVPT
jgi:NADH:ubiquinone oxidoreductase subunit 6 (subunit J)